MKDTQRQTQEQHGALPHDAVPVESVVGEEVLDKKRQDGMDRAQAEAFWAGRNHAMRHSARTAA